MHVRAVVAAVPLAFLMAFLSFLLPVMPAAAVPVECLSNGEFTLGYGPHGLPLGWERFQQGGGASMRWTVDLLSASARTAGRPLLSLSALGWQGGPSSPRLGLRQSVRVVPGQTYRLTLRGDLRCGVGGVPPSSGCGYHPQWALAPGGGDRLPPEGAWHTVSLILAGPGTWRMEHVQTLVPREPLVTLFVALARVGGPGAEWAGLTLERVSLVGPGAE